MSMVFSDYYAEVARSIIVKCIKETDDEFLKDKLSNSFVKADSYQSFHATNLARSVIASLHDDLVSHGYFDESRIACDENLKDLKEVLSTLYKL